MKNANPPQTIPNTTNAVIIVNKFILISIIQKRLSTKGQSAAADKEQTIFNSQFQISKTVLNLLFDIYLEFGI